MPPKRRQPVRSRNRSLWIALALGAALAAALVIASVALRGGSDGEVQPASTVAGIDLAGVPQQGNVLGNPAAPATLTEYADLSCPFCARYSTTVLPALVDRYVRSGRVKFEFRGLAFIRPVDNSERALRYVLAAGKQDKLWDYLERVYANQGAEGTEWFTDDFARSIATQVPGLDPDRLATDAESPAVAREIVQFDQQASAAHVTGTPTFFLRRGSEPALPIVVSELSPDAFTTAIDETLAG